MNWLSDIFCGNSIYIKEHYVFSTTVIDLLYSKILANREETPIQKEIARMIERLTVQHLLYLATNRKINQQVAAIARLEIYDVEKEFEMSLADTDGYEDKAHLNYLLNEIVQSRKNVKNYQLPEIPEMPDGSPIGCDHE